MSQKSICHVTHERVVSHMKESCHTSEGPISHIWMHSYVCHDSFAEINHSGSWSARNYRAPVCACFTSPIHMCARTHSCVWHDSFVCVPWPIHRHNSRNTQRAAEVFVTMVSFHSWVCNDSSIRVPWLIHIPDSHAWLAGGSRSAWDYGALSWRMTNHSRPHPTLRHDPWPRTHDSGLMWLMSYDCDS